LISYKFVGAVYHGQDFSILTFSFKKKALHFSIRWVKSYRGEGLLGLWQRERATGI
jgi:hypothetical protein